LRCGILQAVAAAVAVFAPGAPTPVRVSNEFLVSTAD